MEIAFLLWSPAVKDSNQWSLFKRFAQHHCTRNCSTAAGVFRIKQQSVSQRDCVFEFIRVLAATRGGTP
jgi:hypothetical protein